MGLPSVAGLLLLQSLRGLRPGEALRLQREHLVPEGMGLTPDGNAHLLLGPVKGTKSGRPQSVRCTCSASKTLVAIFYFVTEAGARLTHV